MFKTIEELFFMEMVHHKYQKSLTEDFSFLDNFISDNDDIGGYDNV